MPAYGEATGKMYYTTVGNIRGACGHRHTTPKGAQDCRKKDMRDCQKGRSYPSNGYSDRRLVAIGPDGNEDINATAEALADLDNESWN